METCDRILNQLTWVAGGFLLFALLTLGFGRAFTSISIGIAGGVSILLWVRAPKTYLQILLPRPVAWFCLLFVLVMYIGTWYWHTAQTPINQLAHFKLYAWFLIPVLLMPLAMRVFRNHEKWTVAAFNAVIWNSMALALFAIASVHFPAFYHWIGPHWFHYEYMGYKDPTSPILEHTDAGFFTAIAAYFSWILLLRYKRFWPYYLSCFVLISYYCLLVCSSKTGYIIYFLLALTFCVQYYQKRLIYLFLSIIIALFAAVGIYHAAPYAKDLSSVARSVSQYQHLKYSDFGVREVEFLSALKSWQRAPILGHGTGAKPLAMLPGYSTKRVGPRDITQYGAILVQTGLLGLLSILGLLFSMWFTGLRLRDISMRYTAQGFAIASAVFALIATTFEINPDNYMIILFLAIFYLPYPIIGQRRENQKITH